MTRNSSTQSIFVSTSCLPYEQPIGSRISLYQQHGLNAIELGDKVSITNNLSQINQTKAQFLIHNYFPPSRNAFVLNLVSNDDDICQRSLGMASEAIDFAAHIGAPFYSVHAGFAFNLMPEMLGDTEAQCRVDPDHIIPHEKAYGRFVETVGKLAAHAKSKGVGLLIENNVLAPELALAKGENILLLTTGDEILRFMKDVNDSNVGLLLDTGHLNVSARTLGFDRISFVEQMSPYIRAIHIHDNDGTVDSHQPIDSNSWVIDILRRPEFTNIPLVIEAKFDNMADLSEHVVWLKNEIKRA